jgi:hypothetical protein
MRPSRKIKCDRRTLEFQFSDADLALAIFEDELEHATFGIVENLMPRWVGVQVVVPMIEMIGKILDAPGGDGDNFRAGARRVVPLADVVAVHGWDTTPGRVNMERSSIHCGLRYDAAPATRDSCKMSSIRISTCRFGRMITNPRQTEVWWTAS